MPAGAGAKGHRLYDWMFTRRDHDGPPPADQAGRHWLLVRRNRATGELALYRCVTPPPTPLALLVPLGDLAMLAHMFLSLLPWSSVAAVLGHPS